MPQLHSKFYRVLIFIIGILSTIAYRAIVIFNHYSPFWVEVTWYAGTIGFVWYFAHRWSIENKRDKIVTELQLVDKIEKNITLSDEEKENLLYVLRGLQTSLAKWNYIAIFVFSGLAIVYAVVFQILK